AGNIDRPRFAENNALHLQKKYVTFLGRWVSIYYSLRKRYKISTQTTCCLDLDNGALGMLNADNYWAKCTRSGWIYRTKILSVSIALLWMALCSGCTSESSDDSGNDDTGEPTPASETRFETYNVGLAPGFVGGAKNRRDLVASELSRSE